MSVALLLSTVGCNVDSKSERHRPSSVTEAQKHALGDLAARTGVRWNVTQDRKLGAPTFLAPGSRASAPKILAGKGDSPAAVTLATLGFLTENRSLLKMRAPAEELDVRAVMTDELEMTHVRLEQNERGVPVVGADLYAHYDAEGRLTSMNGTYVPDLARLDLTPKVTVDEAKANAIGDVRAHEEGAHGSVQLVADVPRLVIFAAGASKKAPALGWELRVRAVGSYADWLVTVHAHEGRVLDRLSSLHPIKGSAKGVKGDTKAIEYQTENGTHFLVDQSRPAEIWTHDASGGADSFPVFSSTSTTAWDTTGDGPGSAVDAQAYSAQVYDYYKKRHNRAGLDGKDQKIVNIVHYKDPADEGKKMDNAFFTASIPAMVYGDGERFNPLAGWLDVIAHEFTHGVIDATSKLRYENQSGAMNESISDIFGAIIEHEYKPDPKNNWLMGEGLWKDDPEPLRDMSNPKGLKKQPQPSHMNEYNPTTQDHGGVHINSGIPNKAAHLMTVGGTHAVSKVTVTNPIGWEKLAQVFYRANEKYLTVESDFAAAAKATMQAATDLKLTQPELDTIDCAWKAVGVVKGECVKPKTETPKPAPETNETEEKGGEPDIEETDDEVDPDAQAEEDEGEDVGSSKTVKKAKADETAPAAGGCSQTGGQGGVPVTLVLGLALVAARRRTRR